MTYEPTNQQTDKRVNRKSTLPKMILNSWLTKTCGQGCGELKAAGSEEEEEEWEGGGGGGGHPLNLPPGRHPDYDQTQL